MNGLTARLETTWVEASKSGFLLGEPGAPDQTLRRVDDPISGVRFRLRWLPHREMRSNAAELERHGILSKDRNDSTLFRDPRDPSPGYCFLCADNIRVANPLETLVPVKLAGRAYFAGANFAWISMHHFTVMSAEHTDQTFSPHVLEAMVDLHSQTDGMFRVIYNGANTGATIPWHLHYQITTEAFPIEELPPGNEELYPTEISRFEGKTAIPDAWAAVREWEGLDPAHHQVNLLVAGPAGNPRVHVFARDARRQRAPGKGLIGGFEVCGDLVFSEPETRVTFEEATADSIRATLESVRPAH